MAKAHCDNFTSHNCVDTLKSEKDLKGYLLLCWNIEEILYSIMIKATLNFYINHNWFRIFTSLLICNFFLFLLVLIFCSNFLIYTSNFFKIL